MNKIVFHEWLEAALNVFFNASHEDIIPIHRMSRDGLIKFAATIPEGQYAFMVAPGFAMMKDNKPRLNLSIGFQKLLNDALLEYEKSKIKTAEERDERISTNE